MSEINVNVIYLQNLASRARGVEHTLRAFSSLGGTAVSSSSKVASAYNDLSYRWDMRRGELADVINAIAAGLDKTWQAFQQADSDLAAALDAPPQESPTY